VQSSYTVQVGVEVTSPEGVVRLALEKCQSRSTVVMESCENYVLRVSGRDEFFLGNYPLSQFKVCTKSHRYKAVDLSLSLSVHFNGHFSRWTWVSRCQNVSILDFIGAEDDGGGGDSWSYKTCKTPVKNDICSIFTMFFIMFLLDSFTVVYRLQ